jgi:hypothetical protein
LRQRKADQAVEQLKAGDSWRGTKDGYVFTTEWGEPIYPDTVTSLMTKLIRAQLSWGSCFSGVVVLAKSVSAERGLYQLEGAERGLCQLEGAARRGAGRGGLGEHGDLGAGAIEADLVAG